MPKARPGSHAWRGRRSCTSATYAATASGSSQKIPTGGYARLSTTPATAASKVRRSSTRQGYGERWFRGSQARTSTTGSVAGHAPKRSGGASVTAGPGEAAALRTDPRATGCREREVIWRTSASPGSTHRGAGPTSANQVGRVGGPPPSDSATRTSVRPTRSARANRETFTRRSRSVNLAMTCGDAEIRRSAGVVSSPEVHRKSHRSGVSARRHAAPGSDQSGLGA